MLHQSWKKYLRALLCQDKEQAWRIVAEELVQPIATERVYLDIIGPAQRKLGELLKRKKISLADEHIATSISDFIVDKLYFVLIKHRPQSEKALVVCTPSTYHELGARIMAHFLEADGWNVHWIGSGISVKEITAQIRKFKPKAVFISTALSKHPKEAERLVRSIRKGRPAAGIFVGGDFSLSSEECYDKAWRHLGVLADGIPADPLEGIIQARRFSNNHHDSKAA